MGNRAVITFHEDQNATGIYLHWNGGPESVLAFLEVCKRRCYRSPSCDESYAMARLVGVCHEFLEGGLSLGVGQLRSLDCDNYDNGTYLVGDNWRVLRRYGKGSDNRTTVDSLSQQETEKYNGIVDQLAKGLAPVADPIAPPPLAPVIPFPVADPAPVAVATSDNMSLENDLCYVWYDKAAKEIQGRDRTDGHNLPAFYSKSKRGIDKAWKALVAGFTEQTTMHQASNILWDNGIKTHYWCMMD